MKKEESVNAETGLVIKQTRSMNCSRILNLMVLFGFMVNYMLRVNFTIAIVDMVPNHKHNVSIEQATNFSTSPLNDTNATVSWTHSNPPGVVKFNWSEYEQNMILGSFFWGYVLTELPGGRLSEMIGARPVFGYSMLLASMVTLLTPMAAKISIYCLIFCRVFLGFTLGVTWPAILPLAANWIPPNERSKFMSNMMASTLGAAITLPICGILISAWGWESAFYITGLVGLAWSILWFNLVFETPADHPRISEYERHYIETEIAKQSKPGSKPKKLPWIQILTSLPVWAIVITHGASVFGYFTIVNQLPTYMKYLLHFDIKSNGFLSSLPYLGKYLMALLAGIIADRLLNSEKISKTMTRKIFTFIGVFTPGILMILQVYFGDNQVWSVMIFTIALTLNGAVTGGYLGNGLDIAPNFSDTKLLINTNLNQTCLQEWRSVQNNKLRGIKSSTLPWLPDTSLPRRHQIILNRFRIGHTRYTHEHLMSKKEQPICTSCNSVTIVKHLLTECLLTKDAREKLVLPSNLFEILAPNTERTSSLLELLKETNLLQKI